VREKQGDVVIVNNNSKVHNNVVDMGKIDKMMGRNEEECYLFLHAKSRKIYAPKSNTCSIKISNKKSSFLW